MKEAIIRMYDSNHKYGVLNLRLLVAQNNYMVLKNTIFVVRAKNVG